MVAGERARCGASGSIHCSSRSRTRIRTPSLRGASIHTEIRRLSLSLLRRLELELTTQGNAPQQTPQPLSQENLIKNEAATIRDYHEQQPSPAAAGKSTWLRYPLKLRLSVRQGWNNRVSKQTKMPVEIFELHQPREARAGAIAKACRGLLRVLIGGDDVVGDGMNLINIAALELSEKRPQRALGSFFTTAGSTSAEAKASGKAENGADEIDQSFLASLPPELRDEIAREYGIDLAAAESVHDVVEGSPDDKGKGKAVAVAGLSCPVCGEEMEVWMQHDDEQYPLSGLPSGASPSPCASLSPVLSEGLAEIDAANSDSVEGRFTDELGKDDAVRRSAMRAVRRGVEAVHACSASTVPRDAARIMTDTLCIAIRTLQDTMLHTPSWDGAMLETAAAADELRVRAARQGSGRQL